MSTREVRAWKSASRLGGTGPGPSNSERRLWPYLYHSANLKCHHTFKAIYVATCLLCGIVIYKWRMGYVTGSSPHFSSQLVTAGIAVWHRAGSFRHCRCLRALLALACWRRWLRIWGFWSRTSSVFVSRPPTTARAGCARTDRVAEDVPASCLFLRVRFRVWIELIAHVHFVLHVVPLRCKAYAVYAQHPTSAAHYVSRSRPARIRAGDHVCSCARYRIGVA